MNRITFRDSCSPSLNSDKPLTELHPETFSFGLVPDQADPAVVNLRLASPTGAASTFRRVP